jgi:transposase
VVRRHELTDEQWAVIEPLLPVSGLKGRPRVGDRWARQTTVGGADRRERQRLHPVHPGHGRDPVRPRRHDQQKNRARRGRAGGRPPVFERIVYRRRNVVERCFQRLEQFRAIATRYDKTAQSYRGMIDLTTLTLWLRGQALGRLNRRLERSG